MSMYNQDRGGSDRGGDRGGRGDGERGGGRGDRDAAAANRRPFFPPPQDVPVLRAARPVIDWKDVKLLSRFLSERGKIVPARITAVSAPKQRELALAIKHARYMGLLPYVTK